MLLVDAIRAGAAIRVLYFSHLRLQRSILKEGNRIEGDVASDYLAR